MGQIKPKPKEDIAMPQNSYVFHCTIMGNHNVGKSSLIQRYYNGEFSEKSLPVTKRPEYIEKNEIIIGNKSIKLVIQDTYSRDPR